MKNFIPCCIISFSLLCTTLFGFLFAQCIKSYAEFDYDYTELLCRELTLTGYEEDYYYKTGTSYRLYFEESDEPLVINNITSKKLDKKALTVLKEGQALKGKTVEIGYKENGSSYDGAHMIVELTVDGESVYDLTDWNAFQKNRRAVLFWVWFGFTVLVNLPLILDILEYGGIVKRRRRHRRNRKAREEQIRNLDNRPRNFPNTVWQTEDGTLTLTVSPDGIVTGTVRIPDGDTVKSIPILFDDTAHTTVRIAKLSRRGSGKKHAAYVEIWEADYDSPVEFTAKPKKITYFKKGKTLTVPRTGGE